MLSEPVRIVLRVIPSKEIGDRTKQGKKSLTSAKVKLTNSGFDRPLLSSTDVFPSGLVAQSVEQRISKIVFFALCSLPISLLELTFSRIFMGSFSTLTLTTELIL